MPAELSVEGPDKVFLSKSTLQQRPKHVPLYAYAGITGYALEELLAVTQESPVRVETVLSYSRLALHDQSLVRDGMLAALNRTGVAVINAAPLGMGLLTHCGPPCAYDWRLQ